MFPNCGTNPPSPGLMIVHIGIITMNKLARYIEFLKMQDRGHLIIRGYSEDKIKQELERMQREHYSKIVKVPAYFKGR